MVQKRKPEMENDTSDVIGEGSMDETIATPTSGKRTDISMDGSLDDSLMMPTSGKGFTSKSRKPNWTDHEIRALIEEYDRHRTIMRCRGQFKTASGQVVNNEKRHRIWEQITEAVNRSQPEGINMLGGLTVCTRTVKEVIKKWVNLVNKMKSDIAIQRSKPGSELCMTSRAVNIIVNTNQALDMDTLTAECGGSHVAVKREKDAVVYDDDSYVISEFHETNDYSHLLDQNDYLEAEKEKAAIDDVNRHYDATNDTSNDSSKFMNPSNQFLTTNVKDAILKRKLTSNYDQSRAVHVEEYEPRDLSKRAKRDRLHGNIEEIKRFGNGCNNNTEENYHTEFQWQSGASSVDMEMETNAFNRDIMELQKRKLKFEVEKTRIEKEKSEIEKQKMIIEKETALLLKEKIQIEVNLMREKLQQKGDKV